MFKLTAASLLSLGVPYSLVHGSFKIFLQSLYFWEIRNQSFKLHFLQNSPLYKYTFLPVGVKVLGTFVEAILWKPFQLVHSILSDVSSITKAPSFQCWFQSREQIKISWSEGGDVAMCQHSSLLRNPWSKLTSVLAQYHDGETNGWVFIFRGIFFWPHF